MTTIADFKKLIADEFMAMAAVRKHYSLDGTETFEKRFPPVSIEGIFIYLWAVGAWTISTLFDRHRADVLRDLATLKPHSLMWYVAKAKAYQHGRELPKDESGQICSDVYDAVDEKTRIVRYAVAQERRSGEGGNERIVVAIKVAKYASEDDHRPEKLDNAEVAGLKRYFANIKDAGVPLSIISNSADDMTIDMTIHYNPILLQPSGEKTKKLLDAKGKEVVRLAILRVIENLPFNGDCRNSAILDAVTAIEGVDVADITKITSQPHGKDARTVVGYCTPESGYFKLKSLNLTLIPYNNGNEID